MDRFEGRVALVTGASAGIGEQIAEQLVRAGMQVVGVARRPQPLQELTARLSGEKGALHPLVADLSADGEVRRAFQWVEAVLVNNAALLINQPIQDADSASLQQLVNTNVTSVMLSCREAIQSMKKHGIRDGHIVNINSVLGHKVLNGSPAPDSIARGISTVAYAATKHAITALSQGLRFDLLRLEGFRTRVTSMSPGVVATAMASEEYIKALKDPRDVLQAKDVANAVMFALSSPEAVEISELLINATSERC